VAASDFVFTLHLSAAGRLDDMLSELTVMVLRHAGYADAPITRMAAELRSGVAAGCTRGLACDIEFRAHGGEIRIAVSQGGRTVYRTARRLP
jgi:hypothetical protein